MSERLGPLCFDLLSCTWHVDGCQCSFYRLCNRVERTYPGHLCITKTQDNAAQAHSGLTNLSKRTAGSQRGHHNTQTCPKYTTTRESGSRHHTQERWPSADSRAKLILYSRCTAAHTHPAINQPSPVQAQPTTAAASLMLTPLLSAPAARRNKTGGVQHRQHKEQGQHPACHKASSSFGTPARSLRQTHALHSLCQHSKPSPMQLFCRKKAYSVYRCT